MATVQEPDRWAAQPAFPLAQDPSRLTPLVRPALGRRGIPPGQGRAAEDTSKGSSRQYGQG